MRKWFKSKFCTNGTCLEVKFVTRTILVRNSRHPEQEPLEFTPEEWDEFLYGVQNGEFKFSA